MRVNGWLVTFVSFCALMISACGNNNNNGPFGPVDGGPFAVGPGALTCDQEMTMMDSGIQYEQNNGILIAYDQIGDSYVLTPQEAQAGSIIERCGPGEFEHRHPGPRDIDRRHREWDRRGHK